MISHATKAAILIALGAILACPNSSAVYVLGFEEFAQEEYLNGSDYGGFNWGNPEEQDWQAETDSHFMGVYHNSYGAPEGTRAVHNSGIVSVVVDDDTSFDFIGAYFTAWGWSNAWWQYASRDVTVEGYRNGQLVDSAHLDLRPNGYDWLQADIYGIDELIIYNDGVSDERWWLMDSFTYDTQAESPVPEPSTMLLLGGGLFGAGVVAWTRRRRS